MSSLVAPSDRLLEEGRQLALETERQGVTARLLGGVGIRLLLGGSFDPEFERPLQDLDLIVRRRDARKLEEILASRGWDPARQFNALNGARRLLFHEPGGESQIDVFVEAFEMCHSLPLADALGETGPTLPATELLMTKLQIVRLNAKDRDDCYALFCGCSIGGGGPEMIDPARIARLAARDWGLHHTFELNLTRLRADLGSRGLRSDGAEAVSDAIATVSEALEVEPKSRGWRLRARIGERKLWYDQPEEVQR